MKFFAVSIFPLLIGMNFSFLDPVIHAPSACDKDPPANYRGAMILPRYGVGAVRAKVQSELRSMRHSGFDIIRTLVPFANRRSENADWFDRTKDLGTAPAMVAAYIDDVAQAGFRNAELSFTPQAEASPACRRERWGDCFDPTTVSQSLDFTLAVRRALGAAPKVDLRVDLVNEGCVTSTMAEALGGNYRIYARSLISEYVHEFPNDHLTVSCSIERFAAGRDDIDRAFQASRANPSFYEIHAYRTSEVDLHNFVGEIKAALKGSPLPMTIGETNYGTSEYTDSLIKSLLSAKVRLDAVVFWPLRDSQSRCGIDVPPPYSRVEALGK